jgi:HD-GYP domain-containing protein (c-di-GMP phosphodiesterase class II)
MVASQLHDIGKLLVPRDLLLKPGKLTDEQRAIIQRHSVSGAQIVARIPEVALAVRGVREHHEHWDGTGYPGHKLADEIALSARIIAVADVYDALRSQRSYKREWSVAEAVAEIERGAGTHFEPRVVQALVRLVASGAESPLSAPDETLSQPAA